MKTAHFVLFSALLLGAVWVLSHSVDRTKKISLAVNNNPTPTVEVLPTSIPTETITPTTIPTKTVIKSESSNSVQIIKATYGPPFGFMPTELKVKAGTPVRLEVLSNVDGRGCMGSIMIPQLAPNNIQFFSAGQTNVFEFTPTTPGTYPITCAMGVPHGNLIVE